MVAENFIEFKDVGKVYPNGTVGLSHINLTIPKGQFLVVVGLSGSGKSTLMRTLNRMHDISSGDIMIDGQSIINYKGKQLRNCDAKSG